MRDIEIIDADLRLVSRAWRAARVVCDHMPSIELIDQLLEERSAAAARAKRGWKSPQSEYSDRAGAIPSPL
jgi:hypothetical protein